MSDPAGLKALRGGAPGIERTGRTGFPRPLAAVHVLLVTVGLLALLLDPSQALLAARPDVQRPSRSLRAHEPGRRPAFGARTPHHCAALTLVLADDHPIVLDGLEALLGRERDFRIAARCTNGEETVAAVRHHRPNILVLDIAMPRGDGFEVLERLRRESIAVPVVVLSAALSRAEVHRALHLGVLGIVLKDALAQKLISCIRKVSAGEQYLDSRLGAAAVEALLRRGAGADELSRLLTPREAEMLSMVLHGLRNRHIAAKLGICEGTVKVHLHKIYQKLEVRSRLELVLLSQSRGFV